jgi:hypothetical protein
MKVSLSAHHTLRCLGRPVLHALVLLSAVLLTVKTLNGQDLEPAPTYAGDSESVSVATTGEEERAQDSSSELPWYERIQLGGDFRSRYEGFHQTGRETRNRARFRLRLTVDTDINEDARFHLQVASGDPGTPVSTNQTFTSFFRPKPFNLDRAYLAYNPGAASALTLGMGKFGFPQNRTQMVFDDDLNVEGGWEQVSWDLSDRVGINLVAVQTAVNEVSRDADAYMLAGYGEVRFEGDRADVSVSAANYGWGNPDQIVAGHVDGPLSSILTNALERDDTGQVVGYTSRFNVVDVIAEATIQTGRPGYPIRLLADVAHNTRAANDRASGFWLEAGYGQPRLARTWGATYTYGWIEQDVTPSAFVFSDMPGTNIRLHMIETSYIPKSGLSFDVTLHMTKRLVVVDNASNNLLARLHVAIVARF